jgi:hypothetical protein
MIISIKSIVNHFIFLTERECVFCELETEFVYIA